MQEQNMDNLLEQITAKKVELDRLRKVAPHGLRNLEHSQDLELTYTSNTIEGNTLTAVETTLVIDRTDPRHPAAAGAPGYWYPERSLRSRARSGGCVLSQQPVADARCDLCFVRRLGHRVAEHAGHFPQADIVDGRGQVSTAVHRRPKRQ
jgi:hypothetical protein